MKLSHWEYDSYFKNIDITIIGSGIVGLSTAIELKRKYPNKNILILERGTLPSGASTKNAGFACFGSPSEILDDLKIMSESEVVELVEKRWKGLLNLQSLVGKDNMDFLNLGSFELFDKAANDTYQECADQIDYLNQFLGSIFKENVFSISDESIETFGFNNVQHVIKNQYEGQIHTGKMMRTLLKLANELDITLLNGVEVKGLQQTGSGATIELDDFSFQTSQAIIATNGFAKGLLPELEVLPARAQVLITSEIPNLKVKGTFHIEKGYYYFRNIGNRVLLGGGRNLAIEEETTTELTTTPLIQSKLDQLLSEVILPNEEFKIERRWAGIMGVGSKKTTLVKSLSENVHIGVRLGGMGVAIGSLIGKEVAELI